MAYSTGLFLASATSVVNALADVSRKKAIAGNDLFAAAFWVRLIATAVFAIAFLWHLCTGGSIYIRGDGQLPWALAQSIPAIVIFFLYLLLDTGLVAISILLYYRALQISDLSLSIPFLSFTPAMLVITGSLLLHEVPGPEKVIGVGLVVLGSLVMTRNAFRFGLLGPVKALFRDQGSRCMLGVAFILSITNPIDKKLVIMSDPITYAFAYGMMLLCILALPAARKKTSWTAPLQIAPVWLLLAGILDGSDLLLQFTSHKFIAVVITITLKRAGVVLSVLCGWLIFREKQIGDRLLGSAVMLFGVSMIYLPLSMRTCVLIAIPSVGVALLLIMQATGRRPIADVS